MTNTDENAQTTYKFHDVDLMLTPHEYIVIVGSDNHQVDGVESDVLFTVHIQPDVEDGRVALTMVDYNRLILGRITRSEGTITLHPEFTGMPPETFDANRVYIVGRGVRSAQHREVDSH